MAEEVNLIRRYAKQIRQLLADLIQGANQYDITGEPVCSIEKVSPRRHEPDALVVSSVNGERSRITRRREYRRRRGRRELDLVLSAHELLKVVCTETEVDVAVPPKDTDRRVGRPGCAPSLRYRNWRGKRWWSRRQRTAKWKREDVHRSLGFDLARDLRESAVDQVWSRQVWRRCWLAPSGRVHLDEWRPPCSCNDSAEVRVIQRTWGDNWGVGRSAVIRQDVV